MNQVCLKGMIRNIQYSHHIGNVEYNKAELVVNNANSESSVITIKYKSISNSRYKDGDEVLLIGNIRSFSHTVNGKNKLDLYVFTYFDVPDGETTNHACVSGKICKINYSKKLSSGKNLVNFILKNTIETPNGNLCNYIPCVAFGDTAYRILDGEMSEVFCEGELRSREYKKFYSEDEFNIKVAHEFLVTNIEDKDNEG